MGNKIERKFIVRFIADMNYLNKYLTEQMTNISLPSNSCIMKLSFYVEIQQFIKKRKKKKNYFKNFKVVFHRDETGSSRARAHAARNEIGIDFIPIFGLGLKVKIGFFHKLKKRGKKTCPVEKLECSMSFLKCLTIL